MTENLEPAAPTALVELPGGSFLMGSPMGTGYPEESPRRPVEVRPFSLERHPVTNAQFARFIREAGYVTTAERAYDGQSFEGLSHVNPNLLLPGSLVFAPTKGPVPLDDWQQWWQFEQGACWHLPQGHGSTIDGRGDHPVVHASFEDATEYANWCGRRLPTEAEFEYAARSGRPETRYAWGDDVKPEDQLMANTWQGDFPHRNTGAAGWIGTSPVGSFPSDPLGTVDLIGNVWEWTSTYYTTGPARDDADAASTSCCGAGGRNDTVRQLSTSPGSRIPRRVVKGGSHLCAPEYCERYRPAARQPQSEDTSTSHLGFRCAV